MPGEEETLSLQGLTIACPGSNIVENVRFGRLGALPRTLGTYAPSPACPPGPSRLPDPPPEPWQPTGPTYWTKPCFSFQSWNFFFWRLLLRLCLSLSFLKLTLLHVLSIACCNHRWLGLLAVFKALNCCAPEFVRKYWLSSGP